MITTVRRDWIWLALCLVMALLQFIRGARLEAAVFTALPAVLIIDGAVARPGRFLRRLPTRPVLAVIGVAVGIPLAVAPRYSPTLAVIIATTGLAAVLLAWPAAPRDARREPESALDRGRVAWAAVCLAACGFEVIAYLLSRYEAGAQLAFPAVSDLVGPLLDTDPGRLAFAAAWVGGGIALLRRGWRAP